MKWLRQCKLQLRKRTGSQASTIGANMNLRFVECNYQNNTIILRRISSSDWLEIYAETLISLAIRHRCQKAWEGMGRSTLVDISNGFRASNMALGSRCLLGRFGNLCSGVGVAVFVRLPETLTYTIGHM
jgi:hypothetical protein